MSQDARDAPGGAKEEQPAAKQAEPAKHGGLFDKVLTAIFGVLATVGLALLTSGVGAYFQQRGWAWQNNVAQVEKDTTGALDSLNSAAKLLNARWSASLQMRDALEHPKNANEAEIKKAFDKAENDWELQYTVIKADIQFNVDRPFGIERKDLPGWFSASNCDRYAFDSAEDPPVASNSAYAILDVINHCHSKAKDYIDNLAHPGKAAGDPAAAPLARSSLDHVYWINQALQCVILERAIAMRRSLNAGFSLDSVNPLALQVGGHTYAAPANEADCLTPYRKWYEGWHKWYTANYPTKQSQAK